MKVFGIFFLLAVIVGADEIMQILCEDPNAKCLVAGFDQTNCSKFGSLIHCIDFQQSCRGCETRDIIGKGIYTLSIERWCQSKGGVVVSGSTLRDC